MTDPLASTRNQLIFLMVKANEILQGQLVPVLITSLALRAEGRVIVAQASHADGFEATSYIPATMAFPVTVAAACATDFLILRHDAVRELLDIADPEDRDAPEPYAYQPTVFLEGHSPFQDEEVETSESEDPRFGALKNGRPN